MQYCKVCSVWLYMKLTYVFIQQLRKKYFLTFPAEKNKHPYFPAAKNLRVRLKLNWYLLFLVAGIWLFICCFHIFLWVNTSISRTFVQITTFSLEIKAIFARRSSQSSQQKHHSQWNTKTFCFFVPSRKKNKPRGNKRQRTYKVDDRELFRVILKHSGGSYCYVSIWYYKE